MILSKIPLPLNVRSDDVRIYEVKELSSVRLGNLDVLSKKDRDRYEKIISPLNVLFYAQRLALQEILKEVYGDQQTPVIDYDQNHKPFLKGCSQYISLSHSKDRLVIVFSNTPIGVDLEWMRPESKFDYKHFARRFFTKDEVDFLSTLSKNEQYIMFYKLWTVKEARYKCSEDSIHMCALSALKTSYFRVEDHFILCIYPYLE